MAMMDVRGTEGYRPRIGFLERKMGFAAPGAVCFQNETGIGGPGAISGGRPPIASARFNKKGLTELFNETSLSGKRVIVRADFNVLDPISGKIKSDARIKAGIQTIKELKAKGAEIIILTHNDDPIKVAKKEKVDVSEVMNKLSNRAVAERLTELLREEGIMKDYESVAFVDRITGDVVENAATVMNPGDILMLENTRMDERDVKGSEEFAREIFFTLRPAAYIIDGFSVMHRDQATVTGLAHIMKEAGLPVVAGRLVEKEIEIFGENILENPQHPYVAFCGGAKVADKIEIVKSLAARVDKLVIGGAMLWAFLKAKGYTTVGDDPLKGRTEDDQRKDIEQAREVLNAEHGHKIILPKSFWAYNDDNDTVEVNVDQVEPVEAGFRMGDVSDIEMMEIIRSLGSVKTVIWNGNFGFTDHPNKELAGMFKEGSFAIIDMMTDVHNGGGVAAAGGGDTEKVLKNYMKEIDQKELPITHVSTGGGAMTELLAKGTLPGFEVIDNKI